MKRLIIEKEKIIHNLAQIRQFTGGTDVIGVVKGNGYGLGILQLSELLRADGVNTIAVSRLEEAVSLRKGGYDGEILLMSPYALESDVKLIVEYGLTAAIGSYDSAVTLNGIAANENKIINIHIKLDTGFGRHGFLNNESERVASVARYMQNLKITGTFTHLSNSFTQKDKSVSEQVRIFNEFINELRSQNIDLGKIHISNSCAVLKYPHLNADAVRIGSALLGRLPVKIKNGKNRIELQRVGVLMCEITDVRWLPKGHNIGYANTYKTKRPTRIAVVPVGYADGFGVEKSKDVFRFRDNLRYVFKDLTRFLKNNKLYCAFGNKKIRILGRVSMTSVVLDVTNVDCGIGDCVRFDINPILIDSSVERVYI